jgi:hypothetical protein
VSYAGFRKHVTRNPKYLRRLKKAEAIRESFLKEFHLAREILTPPWEIFRLAWSRLDLWIRFCRNYQVAEDSVPLFECDESGFVL